MVTLIQNHYSLITLIWHWSSVFLSSSRTNTHTHTLSNKFSGSRKLWHDFNVWNISTSFQRIHYQTQYQKRRINLTAQDAQSTYKDTERVKKTKREVRKPDTKPHREDKWQLSSQTSERSNHQEPLPA